MNIPQPNCKCDPVSRLVNANRVGLGINGVVLEVGPARLTVSDLWTLIPPNISSRHSSLTTSITGFVKGWLVDKVFFCGKSCLLGDQIIICSLLSLLFNNPDICNVRNHTLRIESIVFDFRVLAIKRSWKLSFGGKVFTILMCLWLTQPWPR